MLDRLSAHVSPALLHGTSFVAALSAWQEDVEWGLKILASLTAIVCAIGGYLITRRRASQRRELD